MEELIARLEKATGPDRELDGWIAMALGLWPFTLEDFMRERSSDTTKFPAYTASLDAAMTLAKHSWQVASGNCGEENAPWACVTTPDNIDHDQGEAATEPIARCIALLKARGSE